MEQTNEEHSIYYSVNDVMKMLGICRATLYKEINSGRLAIKKVRSRTIISKESLDKYIESLETKVNKHGH